MREFGLLTLQVEPNELKRIEREAERMGLPVDGVIALSLTQEAIESGTINPGALMSAQDHLMRIADEIEENGLSDGDRVDLPAVLRILANFATNMPVPVVPYRSTK